MREKSREITCGQNPRPIDEDLSKEVGVTYESPPSRNQQFTSAGRRQSLQIWKEKQDWNYFHLIARDKITMKIIGQNWKVGQTEKRDKTDKIENLTKCEKKVKSLKVSNYKRE